MKLEINMEIWISMQSLRQNFHMEPLFFFLKFQLTYMFSTHMCISPPKVSCSLLVPVQQDMTRDMMWGFLEALRRNSLVPLSIFLETSLWISSLLCGSWKQIVIRFMFRDMYCISEVDGEMWVMVPWTNETADAELPFVCNQIAFLCGQGVWTTP